MASAAALFAACKAGDAACVRAELARAGAAGLVNAKDVAYVRRRCVHACCNARAARLLRNRRLCAYADAAATACAQFGSTPLHYAAAGGHEDVTRALIEWGADARATDAVRARRRGAAALHWRACRERAALRF